MQLDKDKKYECRVFKTDGRCDTLAKLGIDIPYCCHNCPLVEKCEYACKEEQSSCPEIVRGHCDRLPNAKKSKPVYQYDLNGNLIKIWPAITTAAKTLGVERERISDNLRGKINSAGGYIWTRSGDQKDADEFAVRYKQRNKSKVTPIIQLNGAGEVVERYRSREELLRRNPDWTKSGLLNMLYGYSKSYKGYVFKWDE